MRTLFYISTLVSVFGSCVNLFQIFRINIKWGISDMTVLLFGSSVMSAIQFALTQLPCLVLFQKITPPHVETTMTSFSASVVNLSNGFIGNLTGVFINNYFVGVTSTNMKYYYVLTLIGLAACVFQWFCIPLIPVQEEIDKQIIFRQEEREQMAKEGEEGVDE